MSRKPQRDRRRTGRGRGGRPACPACARAFVRGRGRRARRDARRGGRNFGHRGFRRPPDSPARLAFQVGGCREWARRTLPDVCHRRTLRSDQGPHARRRFRPRGGLETARRRLRTRREARRRGRPRRGSWPPRRLVRRPQPAPHGQTRRRRRGRISLRPPRRRGDRRGPAALSERRSANRRSQCVGGALSGRVRRPRRGGGRGPLSRRGARAPCPRPPSRTRVMIPLAPTPLIAILRGLKPGQAEAVASILVEAGFGAIEVPLNSPEPFKSIEIIARRFGEATLVGAGTVLMPGAVEAAAAAGAKLIVAPNADPAVIERALKLGLFVLPGVATPTEAFAAQSLGASGLKLFPAEAIPPEVVKAWRSVLPKDAQLVPVGGITPERIAPYRTAGADGFGIGSAVYKPGMEAVEVEEKAKALVGAWRGATA